MKKNLLIVVFMLFFYHLVLPENFIISSAKVKTQRSKGSLKQDIGFQVKDVLNNFADLNKKIAQIQIEISELQKHFIEKSENLIDNKRPFKKASGKDLSNALNLLKLTNLKIAEQLVVVDNLKSEFDKNICLKNKNIEKKV
ncbi:MAG: hypothetical protein ABIF12_03630 [bacterium]